MRYFILRHYYKFSQLRGIVTGVGATHLDFEFSFERKARIKGSSPSIYFNLSSFHCGLILYISMLLNTVKLIFNI